MIKEVLIAVMLTSALSGTAQNVPTPPAKVSLPTPPQQPAISVRLIKARLKAFEAEQKQSKKLAKAQTQVAVEQYRLDVIQKSNKLKLQVEQYRASN